MTGVVTLHTGLRILDGETMQTVAWYPGDIRVSRLSASGQRVAVVIKGPDLVTRIFDSNRPGSQFSEVATGIGWAIEAISLDGRTVLASQDRELYLLPAALTAGPQVVPGERPDSLRLPELCDRKSSFLNHAWHDVERAAFSPDGCWVAAGAVLDPVEVRRAGIARIWNARDGRAISPTLRFDGVVTSFAFSPDNRWLAIAVGSGGVRPHPARIWDLRTGREVGAELPHPDGVADAAFSGDGRTLVTACEDGLVRLWDVEKRSLRGRVMRHRRGVRSIDFSPDGTLLATASMDGTVRLWDVSTGDPVGAPLQHHSSVHTALFCQNGQALLSATIDGQVFKWHLPTGSVSRKELETQVSLISGLRVRSDGEMEPIPALQQAEAFLATR